MKEKTSEELAHEINETTKKLNLLIGEAIKRDDLTVFKYEDGYKLANQPNADSYYGRYVIIEVYKNYK